MSKLFARPHSQSIKLTFSFLRVFNNKTIYYNKDMNLLWVYITFLALFIIALPILYRINKKSSERLSKRIETLDISDDAMGFISGQTVFTKNSVILDDDGILFLSGGQVEEITRIAYKDIASIQYKGWTFLSLKITTKKGESIKVAPISRVTIGDKKSLLELSQHLAAKAAARAEVHSDTGGERYFRYRSLFNDLLQELEVRGVATTITRNTGAKWTSLKRGVSAVFWAIIILAAIFFGVLRATESSVKLWY